MCPYMCIYMCLYVSVCVECPPALERPVMVSIFLYVFQGDFSTGKLRPSPWRFVSLARFLTQLQLGGDDLSVVVADAVAVRADTACIIPN